MSDKNDTITITTDDYKNLQKRSILLQALENAGVDNWDGYNLAQDLYREYQGEN